MDNSPMEVGMASGSALTQGTFPEGSTAGHESFWGGGCVQRGFSPGEEGIRKKISLKSRGLVAVPTHAARLPCKSAIIIVSLNGCRGIRIRAGTGGFDNP